MSLCTACDGGASGEGDNGRTSVSPLAAVAALLPSIVVGHDLEIRGWESRWLRGGQLVTAQVETRCCE